MRFGPSGCVLCQRLYRFSGAQLCPKVQHSSFLRLASRRTIRGSARLTLYTPTSRIVAGVRTTRRSDPERGRSGKSKCNSNFPIPRPVTVT